MKMKEAGDTSPLCVSVYQFNPSDKVGILYRLKNLIVRKGLILTYQKRVPLLRLLDSIIVLTAIYLAYFIVNPSSSLYTKTLLVSSLIILVSHHLFALIYRLYHKAWEYASVGEMLTIFKAVTFSILTAGVAQEVGVGDAMIRVLIITWMLHMTLIGGSRFSWRMFRDWYLKPKAEKKRTLIVGAGSAGTTVARQLLHSEDADLKPVAFVDDDPRKLKLEMFGLTVCGAIQDIPTIVEKESIEDIIIAIPSISKSEIRRI